MLLVPTLAALLSFSSTSIATGKPDDNVIRVPLERKSFITRTPSLDFDPRSLVTGVDNTAGYDKVEFLKTHVASIAMKYRATLAAYQSNTGASHPLAHAISAIGTGIWAAANQQASDVGTILPAGGLEKRRRKRDVFSVALDNPTPPSRIRHTKRDDISLSEVNSSMWIGTISVGTPQKNFTVDFDTGSADLILPDQACDGTCDGHARYDPTASLTSVDLGKTFQLAYAGGSCVNGTQYADTVYMGGYEAMNQTFGAAMTYSGMESPTFRPDGVLGMGFSSISAVSASPVFQTMVSAGVVKQAVFGFALSPETGKSELTIGGTNTRMYQKSTLEYVKVSLPAYWQIPLASLVRPGLNNTPDVVVVNKASNAQSIVDTGTTLLIATDSLAQAFYAGVTGSAEIGGGVWSVPCDTVGLLAPTLTFGSRSFTISPATFNLGPVSEGSTDCIAGLAGGGSAYWIIGDVFLQNVYTVFDVSNSRVGFADLV